MVKSRPWQHILPISFLFLFFAWNMFAVTKYDQLEWWQYRGSDMECGVMTSALGLVNDCAPVTHIGYPAVTLYNFQGLILRFASTVHADYRHLTNLGGYENIKEVFHDLNQAVGITRRSVLLSNFIWVGLIYFLFYFFLKSKVLATLWALLWSVSAHVIYYNRVMRPENWSLLFFMGCIFLGALFFYRREREQNYLRLWRYSFFIGLMFVLGLLSKVQIAPACAIFLLIFCFYLWQKTDNKKQVFLLQATNLKYYFIQLGVNMVVFPWWAVSRPEHITPELLSRWPWYLLYGPPPGKESFIELPAIFFFVFGAVSLGVLAAFQK